MIWFWCAFSIKCASNDSMVTSVDLKILSARWCFIEMCTFVESSSYYYKPFRNDCLFTGMVGRHSFALYVSSVTLDVSHLPLKTNVL